MTAVSNIADFPGGFRSVAHSIRHAAALPCLEETNMKKMLLFAAFVLAVSVSASFGTAQIELIHRPYDQHRDQQWQQSQQNQQREDQRRADWQREQWQLQQRQRHDRHQEWQDYDMWLRLHGHDYDNRR
jgi:hypothetical protein